MTDVKKFRSANRQKYAYKRGIEGLFERMIDDFSRGLEICIPVKVVEVQRASRRVYVQPLPKYMTADGVNPRRSAFHVTAWQFAANGFVIDLPIKAGDTGWVISGDRESLGLKDTHDLAEIENTIKHVFEYGVFIPDFFMQTRKFLPDVAGEPQPPLKYAPYEGMDGRMVISSFDGLQRITVGRDDPDAAIAEGEEEEEPPTGDIELFSCGARAAEGDEPGNSYVLLKNGEIHASTSEVVNGERNQTVIEMKGGVVTIKTTKKIVVEADPDPEGGNPYPIQIQGITGVDESGEPVINPTGVQITGELYVTGNITAGSEVTGHQAPATADAAATPINLTTHTHNYLPGPGPEYTPTELPLPTAQ